MVNRPFPYPPPVPEPAQPYIPNPTGFYYLSDAIRAFRGMDGVYEVRLVSFDGLRGEIIDVGKAEDIGERLQNHDRAKAWYRRAIWSPEPMLLQVRAYLTPLWIPWWQRDAFRSRVEFHIWVSDAVDGWWLSSTRP